MRRGRNGLAALVREAMQQDPFAPEALYVFVGRSYDMLKILGWDRNGYAIWSKKIERDEKFRWPRMLDEAVITLTAERNRCLAGVLISGEDRAGRSAAGCPRSIAPQTRRELRDPGSGEHGSSATTQAAPRRARSVLTGDDLPHQ
jgi:transposase